MFDRARPFILSVALFACSDGAVGDSAGGAGGSTSDTSTTGASTSSSTGAAGGSGSGTGGGLPERAIIWSWPCTSDAAAWPECGASGGYWTDAAGDLADYEFLQNAGPHGENVVHTTMHHGCVTNCNAKGTGWAYYESDITTTDAPVPGDSRFLQYFFKIVGTYNWVTIANPGMKFIDWGAFCENPPYLPTRIIDQWWTEGWGGGDADHTILEVEISQTVNHGPTALNVPTNGQWNFVQFQVQSGTIATSTDGCLRIWMNNTDESNPTDELCGIGLRVTGWPGGSDTDNCDVGNYYVNGSTTDAIASEGDLEWYAGGWKYTTAFDPTFGP